MIFAKILQNFQKNKVIKVLKGERRIPGRKSKCLLREIESLNGLTPMVDYDKKLYSIQIEENTLIFGNLNVIEKFYRDKYCIEALFSSYPPEEAEHVLIRISHNQAHKQNALFEGFKSFYYEEIDGQIIYMLVEKTDIITVLSSTSP